MNRRDFLSPATLASGAGLLLAPAEAVVAEVPLLRFQRSAMATVFEVQLPLGTPSAMEAANAALNLIDQLERQLSAYRDDSELCQVNRGAFTGPVQIERRFFELLRDCQKLHATTAGAFDPACGTLIEAWGFFRGPPRAPTPAELQAARASSGLQWVTLDDVQSTVRFHRPRVQLNLGSIGKGYALDRAAELLRTEYGVTSALLVGGRSSILALGTPPGQPLGWRIGLTHPLDPDRRLSELCLKDEALATSANTYRRLEHQGRLLGHLLDPRTGWPGERRLSASAQASSAAQADALATAFFLLDEEDMQRCLKSWPQATAWLLEDAEAQLKRLACPPSSLNKNGLRA